jgi:pimeloyl-ACP methyl ester carboxylesterase
MKTQPFQIKVPHTVLTDLKKRLKQTRWPDEVEGAGWDYGTNLAYMKELTDYWRSEYDWRKQEAALNKFAHFKTEIDGFGIHFIHEKGKGPNPTPLLLLHGWPDSFYRFYKIIPMLVDPAKYGGDPANSFDVIVPSLPEFGFSERSLTRGGVDASELFMRLMTDVLGYERFGIQGGDGGSPIAQFMATAHPEAVVGIHLTDLGWHNALTVDAPNLSSAEHEYLKTIEQSSFTEGAYVMIQGTKPQTLAYGLNDSPVALAAWIIEKFRTWSDCNGDIESKFSKDELLTNIMIYWVTQTINSSIRGYYDGMHRQWNEGTQDESAEKNKVPVSLALFPKDNPPPRETAERFFSVQRFTEMPRGGHFAAMEEPELLVEDMREFFRK